MFFDASWILQIIVLIIVIAALYFLINDFLIDKKLLLNYKKAKEMFDENPNNILLKDLVEKYKEVINRFNIK